jgi:hypothetical protein
MGPSFVRAERPSIERDFLTILRPRPHDNRPASFTAVDARYRNEKPPARVRTFYRKAVAFLPGNGEFAQEYGFDDLPTLSQSEISPV